MYILAIKHKRKIFCFVFLYVKEIYTAYQTEKKKWLAVIQRESFCRVCARRVHSRASCMRIQLVTYNYQATEAKCPLWTTVPQKLGARADTSFSDPVTYLCYGIMVSTNASL